MCVCARLRVRMRVRVRTNVTNYVVYGRRCMYVCLQQLEETYDHHVFVYLPARVLVNLVRTCSRFNEYKETSNIAQLRLM